MRIVGGKEIWGCAVSKNDLRGPSISRMAEQAVESAVNTWNKEMEKAKAAKEAQQHHMCEACKRTFETERGLGVHARACRLKVNYIQSINNTINLPVSPSDHHHTDASPNIPSVAINTPLVAYRAAKKERQYDNQYVRGLEDRVRFLENLATSQLEIINQLKSQHHQPPPPPLGSTPNEEFIKETIRSLIAKLGSPTIPVPTAPVPTASVPAPPKPTRDTLQSKNNSQPAPDTLQSKNASQPATSSTAPPTKPAAPVSPKKSSAKANSSSASSKTTQQKRVDIIGDSMIGGVWNWSRKNYTVKVKSYGGGTSLDMIDMAEMSLRRDPDALIIHSGTNDFDQKVNTKNQLQRVIAKARGKKANIEIGISAICHREDRPELQNKIKDMNNQLKNFCHQHQVTYIDHDDFDGTCLATKKLHPNANGNASLFADFNRTIATIFG